MLSWSFSMLVQYTENYKSLRGANLDYKAKTTQLFKDKEGWYPWHRLERSLSSIMSHYIFL